MPPPTQLIEELDFADFELAVAADIAAFGDGPWRALVAG